MKSYNEWARKRKTKCAIRNRRIINGGRRRSIGAEKGMGAEKTQSMCSEKVQ